MKTIFSLLLMLCMLNASAAKKPVIWEKPSYVSTSISCLKLNSVEFHDTATIVKASIEHPDRYIGNSMHLYGEDNKNYKLKFIKEFKVDNPIPVDERGFASMTLVFEPMPSTTTFFDMLEGLAYNNDWVLGISDAKKPLQVKPYALNEEKIEAFSKDFFHTDTTCFKGRIDGYSRSLGYSSLIIYKGNILTGEDDPISIEINEDGTFERKFVLYYPILSLLTSDDLSSLNVPFLVKPGQTLNFFIGSYGNAIVTDSSGNQSEYSAITSSMPIYERDSKHKALDANEFRLKNYSKRVEEAYENALVTHDYLADRFHYNDIEYYMGKLFMQIGYGFKISYYWMENRTIKKNGANDVPDSLKDVKYPENYSFMRKLPLNNPLAIGICMYDWFAHHLIIGPVYLEGEGYYKDSKDGKKYILYEDSIADSLKMNIDKAIFGRDEISLPMKTEYLHKFYRESRNGRYNFINIKSELARNHPADSLDILVNGRIESIKCRAEKIKAAFHDPKLESLLDEYVNYGINDRQITYTLPDCEATTILKKITDKYKGKYVFLDFWATSCGPCREGIEESKAWREELRNNPDFEFVFITGERSSPQANYDEYVAQNLNGAESYRIPEKDYKKLWELFKFNGIPNYQALDPNGNVLTKFNEYQLGKEKFLENIKMLKNMQK